MHLYGSYYIDPLKFGTWVLTKEWAFAQDTTVYVVMLLILVKYYCRKLENYSQVQLLDLILVLM